MYVQFTSCVYQVGPPEYTISRSTRVKVKGDRISYPAQTEGLIQCLVDFTKSWSSNPITCITRAAYLFATVIPIGALALSSTEGTKRIFDQNNLTMYQKNPLVPNVKSASRYQFCMLFQALPNFIGTVRICYFLSALSDLSGINQRKSFLQLKT